jgi:hypothetical protein
MRNAISASDYNNTDNYTATLKRAAVKCGIGFVTVAAAVVGVTGYQVSKDAERAKAALRDTGAKVLQPMEANRVQFSKATGDLSPGVYEMQAQVDGRPQTCTVVVDHHKPKAYNCQPL